MAHGNEALLIDPTNFYDINEAHLILQPTLG